MIVSSKTAPGRGHVVLQSDHAHLASQFAQAFGNEQFEALSPSALMQFLVLHHDRGWDETDATIGRNPSTGLPYSLVQTPLDELLLSGPRSVAYNRRHHPYCGLLCAMHVWGLFNGRYGLSDKIVMNLLSGEAKQKAEAMLAGVLQSQEELSSELARDPAMAAFMLPAKLMQNYKALQLFDTLSLYFNDHAGRSDDYPASHFLNVPLSAARDTTIELQPLGDQRFRLSPFPFVGRSLEAQLRIYELPVLEIEVDYRQVFAESPWRLETLTLVA